MLTTVLLAICMGKIRKNRHYITAPRIAALVLALLVSGCAIFAPEPGIGPEVAWRRVPGWPDDRHAEAWPALIAGCEKLAARPDWQDICAEAAALSAPDDAQAREFFERHFQPRRLINERG